MLVEMECEAKQRKYTRKIKYCKEVHFAVDNPG
jgi:hypothetical protein